ncbi:MAG: DOMON domain-containing protein [Spirochaetaceae bacterium]
MKKLYKVLIVLLYLHFVNSLLAQEIGMKKLEKDNITVFWEITGDVVEFTVKAKTLGWVAIGFEPTKMMKDADIIIGYVKDGKLVIEDHFATGLTSHKLDTSIKGTNDIIGIEGSENDGFTTIKFSRKLNTKDKYDQKLTVGSTYKVIFAFGRKDNFRSIHSYRSSTKIKL